MSEMGKITVNDIATRVIEKDEDGDGDVIIPDETIVVIPIGAFEHIITGD